MKGVTLLTTVMLLSVAFVTDSCDNRIKGCTDPDSINYDELAEKNDGSCRYEGQAVVWYGEEASEGLVEDGATALTFYVNGDVVGSSAASVYWADAPDCGENGSITFTEDLGKDRTRNFELSVKDQEGFEYWKTSIPLEANSCLVLELTWSTRKKK